MNVDTGHTITRSALDELEEQHRSRYTLLNDELSTAAEGFKDQSLFKHPDPAIRGKAYEAARKHKKILRKIAKASQRRNRGR